MAQKYIIATINGGDRGGDGSEPTMVEVVRKDEKDLLLSIMLESAWPNVTRRAYSLKYLRQGFDEANGDGGSYIMVWDCEKCKKILG